MSGRTAFASSSAALNQTVNEAGGVLTSGNNTLTGSQTINGTVSATSINGTFIGNGTGLTGVNAATASALSCTACVGNQQLAVNCAGSASQGGPATSALNANTVGGLLPTAFQPAGFYATTGANTFTGNQNVTGNLMLTGSLVGMSANFTGSLSAAGAVLPPAGTATASQGFNSNTLDTVASVFNSTAGTAQNQLFRWQAEPAAGSNNTASPAATLNLLYGNTGTPTETGLSVNANGTITFAPGAAGRARPAINPNRVEGSSNGLVGSSAPNHR